MSVAKITYNARVRLGGNVKPVSQAIFATLLTDYGEKVLQQSVANWERGLHKPRRGMLTRLQLRTAGSEHSRTKIVNEWASGILEGAE